MSNGDRIMPGRARAASPWLPCVRAADTASGSSSTLDASSEIRHPARNLLCRPCPSILANGYYSLRAASAVVDQLDLVDRLARADQVVLGSGPASPDFAVRHTVSRTVGDACLHPVDVDLRPVRSDEHGGHFVSERFGSSHYPWPRLSRIRALETEVAPGLQVFLDRTVHQLPRFALLLRAVPVTQSSCDGVGVVEAAGQVPAVLVAPGRFPLPRWRRSRS